MCCHGYSGGQRLAVPIIERREEERREGRKEGGIEADRRGYKATFEKVKRPKMAVEHLNNND